MNEIKESQNTNKEAIFFVVKLLFFYLLFSQGNLFMNSVMSPYGRFHNAFIAEHLNYIQWLKSALILPSVWIIKLFGFYTVHNEMDILIVNGPYLRINYACLGIGVMSFLIAFIIAFPAPLKSKWKLLLTGLALIYVLNVLRIVALGVLLGWYESSRSNFTYHHEIFNIIVYICVFILLYRWIKKHTTVLNQPHQP